MSKKVEILFQDEHYIAAMKPAGILVHPRQGGSNDRRSLMRSLKKQTDLYLYPVHRLDNPVSGVVIFALSKEAVRRIQDLWHDDNTKKKYYALCKGVPDEEGSFTFSLKGDHGPQTAHTDYKRISDNGEVSLMDIEIKTGRKHQIRRHFSRRMHNLIGDSSYGNGEINKKFRHKYKFYRLFLHCYELSFKHPFTDEQVNILSPMPEELTEIIKDQDLKA